MTDEEMDYVCNNFESIMRKHLSDQIAISLKRIEGEVWADLSKPVYSESGELLFDPGPVQSTRLPRTETRDS